MLCSLCSASKHPGEFDFHYRVENIHSSVLLSSLGLHEDGGFCIINGAACWLVSSSVTAELIPALDFVLFARHFHIIPDEFMTFKLPYFTSSSILYVTVYLFLFPEIASGCIFIF